MNHSNHVQKFVVTKNSREDIFLFIFSWHGGRISNWSSPRPTRVRCQVRRQQCPENRFMTRKKKKNRRNRTDSDFLFGSETKLSSVEVWQWSGPRPELSWDHSLGHDHVRLVQILLNVHAPLWVVTSIFSGEQDFDISVDFGHRS